MRWCGGIAPVAEPALADGVLPPGAGLRDLGSHRLKDLDRPEQNLSVVRGGPAGGVRAAAVAG